MEKENKQISRVKFLSWGVGIASLLAIPAFLKPKKKKEAKMVKMLSQDGKLVSIDVSHIPVKKKKVKENEVHTWIINNKSSL